MPCTPPRSEEDIYNTLDTDFFPKRDESNPLLKEILFKEEPRSIGSSQSSSPVPHSVERQESSPLRDLLFNNRTSNNNCATKDQDEDRQSLSEEYGIVIPKIEVREESSSLMSEISEKILCSPLSREEDIFKEAPQKSDHQLLREVLRDTSFQRKYNLRPVDLGGVGTGFVEDMEGSECVGDLAREQIEPVLSLAIQQLQKDFDNTCVALGIHPGKLFSSFARSLRYRSINRSVI